MGIQQSSLQVLIFKKVTEEFGWLSNMSPHSVTHRDLVWPTAEHLFQALRFHPIIEGSQAIIDEIRNTPNPMKAKMIAKKNADKFHIVPRSVIDIHNMKIVLRAKLASNPDLKQKLLDTGTAILVEDVSSRPNESGLFWGAALKDGRWQGKNLLGLCWMDLRSDLLIASCTEHPFKLEAP